MNPEWIVIANASLARFLKRDCPAGPLVPLQTIEHPEIRLKDHELADDRPGREATDNSIGSNRFEPRSDAWRKERGHFAREVVMTSPKETNPSSVLGTLDADTALD
jgi:hypothetical protein